MNFRTWLKIAILIALIPSVTFAGTLYVVVSNNLRGKSFSASEIKHILLGETATVNNARVHLIYPSYSSPQIEILSQFVGKGKGSRNLKSYWSKMIFTGRGTPPMTANDTSDLKRMLAQDNAIGVSSESEGLNVVYTINE